MANVDQTEISLREESTALGQVSIKIVDQLTYNQATRLLTEKIIPFRKRWAEYWEPLKKSAHEAHKAILKKFKDGDEPAERAEAVVKAEIRRWTEEQEKIQQELQRKAQEEAEARERAYQLEQAVFAEAEGVPEEEIQAITSAPVTAVAEPVAPTYQRDSSVPTRDNWKCRVTDLKALCRAIGAGKAPVNYVLPNESVLNARARADRETLNLPGCKPWNDKIVSGRTR